MLRVRATDGRLLVELNLPGSAQKAESVVWIAASVDEYRLEVTAVGQVRDRDQYRIRLDRPRTAVPADQKGVAAQKAYSAGRGFESKLEYSDAIEQWEKALTLYRDSTDREREATALSAIGFAYGRLGHSDQALGYYEKALPIFREIHDRRGEGEALNGLGDACYRTGKSEKAIEYFHARRTIDLPRPPERRGTGIGVIKRGGIFRIRSP